MSAFRLGAVLGAHIIDCDYQLAGDGTMALLHDTTVDRTTAATGAITNFAAHNLPDISMPEVVGSGWADEPLPTVEQLFRELGGKVLITIETKGGLPGVAPLAALVIKYGLQRSVYINTPTASVAQAITTAGCMPHVYGVTDSTGVTAAATAGAKLIEIPYNASSGLVSAALASGIHRVIAAPISLRSNVAAMTAGIQGYVSDAPGYATRVSGNARSTSSLAASVAATRRGPGWVDMNPILTSEDDWLTTGGILTQRSSAARPLMRFGDISGTPATSGSISYKFKYVTLPVDTSKRAYARVMCPEENGTGADTDTKGYVISMLASGQLKMWESPAGAYGAGIALGTTPTGAALVAGTVYVLRFDWTATTVALTRVDTGATTGVVASAAWRGSYIYAGNTPLATSAVGECRVTDIAIT
jgi:Glycerophosphoryl diester phosphodiesterase